MTSGAFRGAFSEQKCGVEYSGAQIWRKNDARSARGGDFGAKTKAGMLRLSNCEEKHTPEYSGREFRSKKMPRRRFLGTISGSKQPYNPRTGNRLGEYRSEGGGGQIGEPIQPPRPPYRPYSGKMTPSAAQAEIREQRKDLTSYHWQKTDCVTGCCEGVRT